MVAKLLAKSMVETKALYAAEDHQKRKGNVELLTGRKATSFEELVKREIQRYFKQLVPDSLGRTSLGYGGGAAILDGAAVHESHTFSILIKIQQVP
ncbi:hypothetical protein DL765_008584 [Monosporascus sp. GIB2]|nr:hypothetical protein DL765_008584 [Monosporascus sp. GIB2]